MIKDSQYQGTLHKTEDDDNKKLNVKIDYSNRVNDNSCSYFTFCGQTPQKDNLDEKYSIDSRTEKFNNNSKKKDEMHSISDGADLFHKNISYEKSDISLQHSAKENSEKLFLLENDIKSHNNNEKSEFMSDSQSGIFKKSEKCIEKRGKSSMLDNSHLFESNRCNVAFLQDNDESVNDNKNSKSLFLKQSKIDISNQKIERTKFNENVVINKETNTLKPNIEKKAKLQSNDNKFGNNRISKSIVISEHPMTLSNRNSESDSYIENFEENLNIESNQKNLPKSIVISDHPMTRSNRNLESNSYIKSYVENLNIESNEKNSIIDLTSEMIDNKLSINEILERSTEFVIDIEESKKKVFSLGARFYKLLKITAYHHLFFPKIDVFATKIGEYNTPYRLIYDQGLQFLTNRERQCIQIIKEKFEETYEGQKELIKIFNTVEITWYLRFYYECLFDLKETIYQLAENLIWQNEYYNDEFQPYSIYQKFLQDGSLYWFGRDCCLRPIFIVNMKDFLGEVTEITEIVYLFYYFARYALYNLLIHGQVENFVGILDFSGVDIGQFDVKSAKDVWQILNHWKGMQSRLFRLYILNITENLEVIIKREIMPNNIISNYKVRFGRATQLRRFGRAHVHSEMKNHISEWQLEIKYGGRIPNMDTNKNYFWPPKEPNSQYFLDHQKIDEVYLSIKQYVEIYDQGLFEKGYKVCPEIIEQYENSLKIVEQLVRKKLKDEKTKAIKKTVFQTAFDIFNKYVSPIYKSNVELNDSQILDEMIDNKLDTVLNSDYVIDFNVKRDVPKESPPPDLILKLPQEGRLGCLKASEKKILYDFRSHVRDNMKINDPKFDDWYLLRFCRARKFILPDIIAMWEKFYNWRKEIDVDNGIQIDYQPIRDFAKENWIHGYYSISRDGYPVYIERYEKTDIDKILTTYTEDQITKYYVNSYEMMLHCIWPECSKAVGRRIDAVITILDVKGLGIMRMLQTDTRKFMSMATGICQNYYPECAGKMFIVNTGMAFSALWSVLKLMLDEKTRDKIDVLGSNYLKQLTKYIDPDNLPKSLGGNNSKEVNESIGPWTEYVAKCTAEKNYFADGVVQGDPWKEPARAALKESEPKEEDYN